MAREPPFLTFKKIQVEPCSSVDMSFTHARKAQTSLLERTLFATRQTFWLHSANRTSRRYGQRSGPAEQDLQLTSFLFKMDLKVGGA